MQIEINAEALDLNDGFSIQIDNTNPAISERGSQSVPASLPYTPRNIQLLQFAGRLDHATPRTIPCRIVDGGYVRTGVANIVSTQRPHNITVNIGFDESEAYSKWKNAKINYIECPTETYETHSDMFQHLQQVHAGLLADAPYCLFPVLLEKTDGVVYDNYNVDLNMWDTFGTLAWDERDIIKMVDGTATTIHVPEGYAVAPFLRVGTVLDIVFTAFGFVLDENPFISDEELSRVVILHNVADACVSNTLHFCDLMPTCTVEEFLHALYVRFGMVYAIDTNTRLARVKLMRDILNLSPSIDITPFIRNFPMVVYETPRQLRLSAKTSFTMAQPAAERYEDFIADKAGQIIPVPQYSESSSHVGSVVYEKATGNFYSWDYTNSKSTFASSPFFAWDRKTEGLDEEELSSIDECVPVGRFGDMVFPLYLTGAVHHHTYLKVAGTTQTDKTENSDTPLSFCLALPKTSHTFGSSIPVDGQGNIVNISTGPFSFALTFQFHNGLFSQFWRQYDAMLRHAWLKVEQEVGMPPLELLNIDMLRPVVILNSPALIHTMSYQLPAVNPVPATLSMRTLRTENDDDIDDEQAIPQPFETIPVWKLVSVNIQEALDAMLNTIKQEYYDQGYVYVTGTGEYHTDEYVTPVNDPEIWENPPTEIPAFAHRTYQCRGVFHITARYATSVTPSSQTKFFTREVDPMDYAATFQAVYPE